jgi:hypothetical protein
MFASLGNLGAEQLVQPIRAAAAAAANRQVCTTKSCEDARSRTGMFNMVFGTGFASLGFTKERGVFGILFYVVLAAFVVFLTLMFVHFTMYPIFSFSPNDSGFIPIPTASDRQLAFKVSPATYDVSANFIGLPPCSYTISSDVYLNGGFLVSDTPRVILYRSNTPVTSGGTTDELVDTYPNTNIIMWLDPHLNDLYVSAITTDPLSLSRTIQTSNPIENIPIRKVFRITVVFTPQFIEIYMDGKLEQSMALLGQLVTIPDNSYIFSVIRPINNTIMTGNISMYPRILTAREVSANEAKPSGTSSFFGVS